jgi:predicted transcriptional regulator
VAAISKDGQALLDLIGKGVNTETALDKATGRDPEQTSRTLAALARRGLITRRFSAGEMRYFPRGPVAK